MLKRKLLHYENSTICLYSDINASEMLPRAYELRANGKHNNKNFASSSAMATTLSTNVKSVQQQELVKIEYPASAIVFQNASYLARVAEPLTRTNDSKLRYEWDE
jgi:hypothetical protein